MKITDRIILKTIDGKIVVRPIADQHFNNFIEFEDSKTRFYLNEKGIEDWNNGVDIELMLGKNIYQVFTERMLKKIASGMYYE